MKILKVSYYIEITEERIEEFFQKCYKKGISFHTGYIMFQNVERMNTRRLIEYVEKVILINYGKLYYMPLAI
jgi:hypothetical protein